MRGWIKPQRLSLQFNAKVYLQGIFYPFGIDDNRVRLAWCGCEGRKVTVSIPDTFLDGSSWRTVRMMLFDDVPIDCVHINASGVGRVLIEIENDSDGSLCGRITIEESKQDKPEAVVAIVDYPVSKCRKCCYYDDEPCCINTQLVGISSGIKIIEFRGRIEEEEEEYDEEEEEECCDDYELRDVNLVIVRNVGSNPIKLMFREVEGNEIIRDYVKIFGVDDGYQDYRFRYIDKPRIERVLNCWKYLTVVDAIDQFYDKRMTLLIIERPIDNDKAYEIEPLEAVRLLCRYKKYDIIYREVYELLNACRVKLHYPVYPREMVIDVPPPDNST